MALIIAANMKLTAYRAERNISQASFAEMMAAAGFPATQSLVSQWERGEVVITAERAVQIETVTDGAVPRSATRPDLFGAVPQAAGQGT